MLLGVIADDFTGASDIANTLTREGMRTRLFISATGDTGGCDAGVVALKSRSNPASEAVSQSLAALAWLQDQGCHQFVFKYCSTFDSTPDGNIGPVAAALADRLGAAPVVVCPAFPGAGRTLYQGHLFVHDRLLSESGMERHPLNPMTDPDIRRWLHGQIGEPVGHIALATVREGVAAMRAAFANASERFVVVDAIDDHDLCMIGHAAASHRLVTGGSGIALGLPDNFRAAGGVQDEGLGFVSQSGPGVVLSGSCSDATRAQVSAYIASGRPHHALDADGLMRGEPGLEAACRFIDEHIAGEPLIYSSADNAETVGLQNRYGKERSAAAIESYFGALARYAVARGCRRIVTAGGETSGAVVSALGLQTLDIGAEIAPGVPAVSSCDGRPLALALKSGNFGGVNFFADALSSLGANHA